MKLIIKFIFSFILISILFKDIIYDEINILRGRKTVSIVISELKEDVEKRISSLNIDPKDRITLLAIKDEYRLEVWKRTQSGVFFVKDYPIKGLSGKLGPKLREGDRQVPEGIYKIDGLNPNSSYHLSIKLNYPNKFDLSQANKDGRKNVGSNIFIHGKDVSIGCLAIGDKAIEEIFYITNLVGANKTRVIIAPKDPRKFSLYENKNPEWVNNLYKQIDIEFTPFLLRKRMALN